jgi:enoyl-CoA hydratase/carnithine racemase
MDPEQAKDWGLIDEIVENRGAMPGATARIKSGVTAPASGGLRAKYAIVMAAGLI